MTYKTFNKLYSEALKSDNLELYIAERGWQEWMDEEMGGDAEKVAAALTNIFEVAHMSIRSMIALTGMTQAAFAERFCVSFRSVQSWATNHRECPSYVRLLIADALGCLTVQRGGDNAD